MIAAKSAATNTWPRSATSKGDAERALADKEAVREVAKTMSPRPDRSQFRGCREVVRNSPPASWKDQAKERVAQGRHDAGGGTDQPPPRQ